MASTQETTIHVDASVVSASNNNYDGVWLGNGKVGIQTNIRFNIDVDRIVTTRDVEVKNGQYMPNVMDVFGTCRFALFDNVDYTTTECVNSVHDLQMLNGVLQSTYTIVHLPSGSVVDVTRSLYCLRHMPFGHMQTLEITPRILPDGVSSVRIFHESYTKDNILTATYENPLKYTQSGPVHQFIGVGNDVSGATVAFASSYMFDQGVTFLPQGIGFSYQAPLKNYQFNAFELTNLVVDTTVRMHVLTFNMTSFDFDDPRTEAISMATKVCSQVPVYPSQTVAAFVRAGHTKAWDKLWKTRVQITPKLDASPDQRLEVQAFNKLMNVALYNIYSSVRENFSMDINSSALSIIDLDGSMLYDADLWLVPLLLIMKPDLARPVIEYRYKNLGAAQALAAAYGLSGAKFPFTDDAIGYKSNLYYVTTSYMHVFNTCMVAVNAWNYYRISRDRDWLSNRGFPIIKEVAIFLSTIIEQDDVTGVYTLRDVRALNDRVSLSDNAFTNNLCKMALRYAIESSYELKYDVPDVWYALSNGLGLPKFGLPKQNTVKFDNEWNATDTCAILEPCFMFTPSYWQMIFNMERVFWTNIVNDNLQYWTSAVSSGNEQRPTNVGLRAIMTGVYMSQYPTALINYMDLLNGFVDRTVFGPWYKMHPDLTLVDGAAIPYNASAIPLKNSLTSNSIFLMIILQGICQAHIVGGISDSRFYYEDLKLSVLTNTTMPNGWNFVTLASFGTDARARTFDVRQNGSYVPYVPPYGLRNSGIVYDDFSNTP